MGSGVVWGSNKGEGSKGGFQGSADLLGRSPGLVVFFFGGCNVLIEILPIVCLQKGLPICHPFGNAPKSEISNGQAVLTLPMSGYSLRLHLNFLP